MKKISKKIFTAYVEGECDRRLVIDLGDQEPAWLSPLRVIIPRQRIIRNTKAMLHLGHEYEQRVYQSLMGLPNFCASTKYNIKSKINEVVASKLVAADLQNIYLRLIGTQSDCAILAEKEFLIPDNYIRSLFSCHPKSTLLPVEAATCRPDLLVIGNALNAVSWDADGQLVIAPSTSKKGFYDVTVRELLVTGEVRDVPPHELASRIGISVLDVKNTLFENVVKRHFMEILFYMHVLSALIQDWGLTQNFFVRIDTNGIIPRIESISTKKFANVYQLYQEICPLGWDKSLLIYKQVWKKMTVYWSQTPLNLDNVPLNLHNYCGFCEYLEDCKQSLGMHKINPADWSLRLIPYTSTSIAYQLENKGFKTIGDVVANLNSIPVLSTPEPLYAERPLLELRSKALATNSMVPASIGTIHSSVIPRYSSFSLIFCCENDPTNDRVIGIGYYLDLSVAPTLPYALIFDRWWTEWDLFLNQTPTPTLPISHSLLVALEPILNNFLARQIDMPTIQRFAEILLSLPEIQIISPGTSPSGKVTPNYRVFFADEWLNEGPDPSHEYDLVVEALRKFHLILELCNILEHYCVVTSSYDPNSFFGPDLSIFYWAQEQYRNFQEVLERHFAELLVDPVIQSIIGDLVRWVTPPDSGISHPFQPKKMYNLHTFTESAIGFPGIINNTWHQIACKQFGKKFNFRYWVDHFNYLDFGNWLEYLHQLKYNPSKAHIKGDEIKNQIFIKMRAINRLRQFFQSQARDVISQKARTISCEEYRNVQPFSQFSLVGEIWYLYSKLNGAMDEMTVQQIRSDFPDFSIAKLTAAEISNLTQIPGIGGNKYHYQFDLVGLSSNVKVNEGNRVLILPDELRDLRNQKALYAWTFDIRDMVWISSIGGYHITTESSSQDLLGNYRGTVLTPKQVPNWFLFPTSFDAWTGKLANEKREGLLQNNNFGNSWLADRLAYLWDLSQMPTLALPASLDFEIQEICLYYPEILEMLIPNPPVVIGSLPPLHTRVSPPPDPSQHRAIVNALCRIISGIQGPPGTGKSATIAALIDEFLERNVKRTPLRVLVTAFSYAAIRVLIDKIRNMKDRSGAPTAAAQAQLVFIRSDGQDPIDPVPWLSPVDDLVRKGSSWQWNGKSKTVTPQKLLNGLLQSPVIIFANAYSLYNLQERVSEDFYFDLIIVDEASQVPTDQIMASFQYLTPAQVTLALSNPLLTIVSNKTEVQDLQLISPPLIPPTDLTQVVIVGDYNQLPPVQPIQPPRRFLPVLESLFSYYVKYHRISNTQLDINYRSHQDIVDFTKMLGIYRSLTSNSFNATRILPITTSSVTDKWLQEMLDPNKVVVSIIHKRPYDMGVSPLEAHIVVSIVIQYFQLRLPATVQDEQKLWEEQIGIVSPHNAQGKTIIQQIYNILTTKNLSKLPPQTLMGCLKRTIYSVEKFQGSDRDLIIATIGVTDKDQLEGEETFIYDLNRFNVLTSRAKSKVILVCGEQYLNYIPRDQDVMDYAARIRKYTYNFCTRSLPISIPNESGVLEKVEIRWH